MSKCISFLILTYITLSVISAQDSLSITWTGPFSLGLTNGITDCGWGFWQGSIFMWCSNGMYQFDITSRGIRANYDFQPKYANIPHSDTLSGMNAAGQYVVQIEDYLYYWEQKQGNQMKWYRMSNGQSGALGQLSVQNHQEVTGHCVTGMKDDINDDHLVFILGGYDDWNFVYVKYIL